MNYSADVPDVDTGSETFANWYYRLTVYSSWFPSAQFVMFLAMGIYGWSFVNLVTLQRKNPFTSGNDSYGSFKKMLILVPILFMFSGLIVLRQTEDLSEYCKEHQTANGYSKHVAMLKQGYSAESVSALKNVIATEDRNMLFLHSLQMTNYLGAIETRHQVSPDCHIYTSEEVFNWNFYMWTLGFLLLGIQFTHADIGPMKNFTLTWASM